MHFDDMTMEQKYWLWVTNYIARHEHDGCHLSDIAMFFKNHEREYGKFVLITLYELENAGIVVSDDWDYYYLG